MTSGLIDTTEMYLRTVFELEEERVVPLRARLAERLHHSGPTVSETCARLEREGLLLMRSDRSLELTDEGRTIATSVMRKHRLAELLLVDVLGLPYESVHAEACRWEHVISDEVEARLTTFLGDPATCPHGNPIPRRGAASAADGEQLETLTHAVDRHRSDGDREVVVRRIGESVQGDPAAMVLLDRAGVRPGVALRVVGGTAGVGVRTAPDVDGDEEGDVVDLPGAVADHVLVTAG